MRWLKSPTNIGIRKTSQNKTENTILHLHIIIAHLPTPSVPGASLINSVLRKTLIETDQRGDIYMTEGIQKGLLKLREGRMGQ